MKQRPETLASFGSAVIDSPATWALTASIAFVVATLLVRYVPVIRRSVSAVEAERQKPIDGLRGVLGIAVFTHHTVITWFFVHGIDWRLPPSRFVTHLGQTSVALFFMITAFLFWSRVLARRDQIDWRGFIVSRLVRLYPAYLFMLGLMLAAILFRTAGTPTSTRSWLGPLTSWLMFTMFGAPNLNGVPQTNLMVAGVTWSLQYEWLFYLSLPLLAFITRYSRQPTPALLSAAVLTALFWRLGGISDFSASISQSFLGGIVAAYCVRSPALCAICRTKPAGLGAIAALASVVSFLPTAYSVEATAGLTLFFVAIAAGQDLFGLLRLPGLLWLGDITYPIYLLHGLLLWLVFQALAGIGQNNSWTGFLGMAAGIDVVLVLLSSLVFLVIERPVIIAGRRHYPGRYRSLASHPAKIETARG